MYNFIEFISLNENFYDDFKNKYSKIFKETNEDFKNQLVTLLKKIDNETDSIKIIKIFDDFLSTNQNTLNNKIDNIEGQETINKLLSDNLKTIYFALESIKLKLNDKEFTDIFDKSRDENFRNLMNMDKTKFSNNISTYIEKYLTPQLKKTSGIENKETKQKEDVQEIPQNEDVQEIPQNEDKIKQLKIYKEKSKEWFGYIYDMIWKKLKSIKSKLNNNRQLNKNIDDISNLMKNSDNEEAKKQLFKKIVTLSKEELNKIGQILGINTEEIGEF